MATSTLYLIDGHALCYRSFYAIRELRNSQGVPTNAIYGFVNILRKILRDHQPDFIAVCFDSKEKTKRQEKYAEYKIQRPSMPDDLRRQIPLIIDVIKGFNIQIFAKPGFEADDIMATFARQAEKTDLDVVVVSDDKDLFQLASKQIKFFSIRQDKILNVEDVKAKLGFDPEFVSDFLALSGDKSDNIPGVSGIGDVTARNLVNQFGRLENIYKNLNKVEKDKVREKLANGKKEALLSKELTDLDFKVPVKFKASEFKVTQPDQNRLHDLFKTFEFHKLAQEFSTEETKSVVAEIRRLESYKDVKEFLLKAEKKGYVAILPKLNSADLFDQSKAVYLSVDEKYVYIVEGAQLSDLKELLKHSDVTKVTYNVKELIKYLYSAGLILDSNVFDVLLAGYLSSNSATIPTIGDLAWNYSKLSLSENDREISETAALNNIYQVLKSDDQNKELNKLFREIEMPLSFILAQIELTGVKIDTDLLSELQKKCAKEITSLTKKLYSMAGEEFNINSPKQLSKILFEKLNLPIIKKTKTGISTDEGVLSILSESHKFPSLVLEYRQLSKLQSTYIESLPKLINETTGRIHTHFDQIGAETGRLSSKQPNLQNIPIRTELGKQIRKAFIPSEKSRCLLSADYSQIELRVLAHLSKDPMLSKAFKENQDIHQFTASLMFDIDEKKVTQEMRYSAKRVNFGIVYGMSAFGLSKDLSITPAEAQEFINRYFIRYPKVKSYMDEYIQFCEKHGYVETLLKRRRYIPDIKSKNNNVRQFAQRQAINTPVQGTAADLIKLAMINVDKEMKKLKLKSEMIMTVHDELVFDTLNQEKMIMADLVKKAMESSIKLDVPIKASVKIGMNWLEMKDV